MSEKNKIEIEELLNALVDDEATERQKNEFDRLLRHDPSIAEQLAVMQRQRQILGALPVDSAPVSLVEDVLSGLERKRT
ncbi:MAG: anti-sigma factor family protein, partial [Planctomycetota bacterium]